MITIEEFMTQDPYTLRAGDSLADARNIMTEKHIRHIPVTDNDKHLLGLVTQRDVLAATDPAAKQKSNGAQYQGDMDIKLSDIMIRDVRVIKKNDSVRRAALYIQQHKYGCLPVVEDGYLIGIITDSDFIDIAINLLEQAEVAEEDIEISTEEDVEEVTLLEFEETQ